jgi:NhaC family Na+:H+ antiporter
MAGVLGVATAAYLPYAFFNLLSPLISLIYGFTGFRIEHIEPPAEAPAAQTGAPGAGDQLSEESPS